MLKKIFIVVFFLFPLGEIVRLDSGLVFVLKPIDIGIGLIFFLWLAFKISKKQKIKQSQILISIILFVACGFFSLIINSFSLTLNEFFVSLSYLIRWTVYAGMFFVIGNFDKDFKKHISNLLVLIGSLIVGLGYLQYFFYPSLKNLFYLGWDEHMYRMFSVFLDPNFAGAFFVLFFLFLINQFFKKKNILMGILLILTLGAIFLTFSRSALIMLVVSSSLLFIMMNKKTFIIPLLVIVVLVLTISSRYFNIENINLFRIVSTEARLETAKNAIRISTDHPIFGVGFNSYKYFQIQYGFRNKNAIISHADSGPDNSILFVLATTGIVGLILYLFLWLRIIKSATFLSIASVVGVFVDSMFINSLFYPFIMLWIWIILAL